MGEERLKQKLVMIPACLEVNPLGMTEACISGNFLFEISEPCDDALQCAGFIISAAGFALAF
jgi:hypothetical protein